MTASIRCLVTFLTAVALSACGDTAPAAGAPDAASHDTSAAEDAAEAAVPGGGDDAAVPDGGADGAGPESPCRPAVHDTQGHVEPDNIQRYRFIGASADGRRLAVLRTHVGPGSGSPFAAVYAFEEGVAAPLWNHLAFMMDPATEELLHACEQQAVADSAADLATSGIVLDANLPAPEAWCQDGDVVFVGAAAPVRYRWGTTSQPCAGGASDPATQWSLCLEEGDACVFEEADDCDEGGLALVDVFRVGTVLWVVGARAIDVFGDGNLFYTRMTGGRAQP
jgi:hypothetical protein